MILMNLCRILSGWGKNEIFAGYAYSYIEENLILISKDTAFSNYDVNLLW